MLLVEVDVFSELCLLESKTARHCIYVLPSASTPVPLTVLSAKQNQRATISFHQPLTNK
jgi:hypothetical protein